MPSAELPAGPDGGVRAAPAGPVGGAPGAAQPITAAHLSRGPGERWTGTAHQAFAEAAGGAAEPSRPTSSSTSEHGDAFASVNSVIDPSPSTPEPRPSPAADVAGRRRRFSTLARRRAAALFGLVAGAVVLGGCKLPTFYTYRGVTKQEHDSFLLYSGTVIAAIVVGVIVGALILWSVFRYRRRSDELPRQFQYHIPLEIFYTVVPIIIVLVLFAFTVKTENTVDAVAARPAVSVKITAFQWGWKFDYVDQHRYVIGIRTEDPDPIGLGGRTCTASAPTPNDCLGPGLVMPIGQAVDISLVSNDVVHSFYVPQFLFSRMALPGVDNRFTFTVDRGGIFRAQCNNICGLYHSQMFFHVVALPPAQFAAWVKSSQTLPDSSAGPVPTGPQSAVTVVPSLPSGAGHTTSSGTGPSSRSVGVGSGGGSLQGRSSSATPGGGSSAGSAARGTAG